MIELVVTVGGDVVSRHSFEKDQIEVGRAKGMDLRFAEPLLSKHHATIRKDKGVWFIVDRGSSNGTFLNGEKTVFRALNDGDVIEIGSYKVRFKNLDAAPPPSVVEVQDEAAHAVLGRTFATGAQQDRVAREQSVRQTAALLQGGKAVHVLDRDIFLVGSGPRCDRVLARAPHVGAVIVRGESGWSLVATGLLVKLNGNEIPDRVWLMDGDQLVLGELELVFKLR